jgi:phosphatidylinositol-3-phosphatase
MISLLACRAARSHVRTRHGATRREAKRFMLALVTSHSADIFFSCMRLEHVVFAFAVAASFGACGPAKGPHDSEGRVVYLPSEKVSPSVNADAKSRDCHSLKTVWIIVMENHDWSSIRGSPSAPYINGTLLPMGAHAERYSSPYDIHPSEPNYIWLEAADDLEIRDNDDPHANYRTTKNHLTNHLEHAGVSWRSYQEGIEPGVCPVSSRGLYRAKHNPMVYFDDVTDGRDPQSKYCIEHVRPYTDLAGDLETGKVAKYNFITPDLCNDMHDSAGCATPDQIWNGDVWLSREVPKIMASKEYQEGGVIFVTWDESEGAEEEPIGLIALSKYAKPGYANTIKYTHSSLVRTVHDIFALGPYMRDANNVTGLDDLFVSYP